MYFAFSRSRFSLVLPNFYHINIWVSGNLVYNIWLDNVRPSFAKVHFLILCLSKIFPYCVHPFQARFQVHQNINTFLKNIQVSCSSNQCSNFFLCTSVLRPIRTQKSFSAIIVRTVFSDNPVNSQVSFTERRSFPFSSFISFFFLIPTFPFTYQIQLLQCTFLP